MLARKKKKFVFPTLKNTRRKKFSERGRPMKNFFLLLLWSIGKKNMISFLFLNLWVVFQKRRMFSSSSSLAKRRRKYFLFLMWRIEKKMNFFSTSLRWQKKKIFFFFERIEGFFFKLFLPRIEEKYFRVEELFLVPSLDAPPKPPKSIKIFSSSAIQPKEEKKIFSNHSYILRQEIVDYLHSMIF